MAEVLRLHHAQGLTPGCLTFTDELRSAGHVVHAVLSFLADVE